MLSNWAAGPERGFSIPYLRTEMIVRKRGPFQSDCAAILGFSQAQAISVANLKICQHEKNYESRVTARSIVAKTVVLMQLQR